MSRPRYHPGGACQVVHRKCLAVRAGRYIPSRTPYLLRVGPGPFASTAGRLRPARACQTVPRFECPPREGSPDAPTTSASPNRLAIPSWTREGTIGRGNTLLGGNRGGTCRRLCTSVDPSSHILQSHALGGLQSRAGQHRDAAGHIVPVRIKQLHLVSDVGSAEVVRTDNTAD